MHRKLTKYVKAINEFYKSTPAFYEIEDSWAGFEWLAPDDADCNIVSFIRRDRGGNEVICLTCYSGSDVINYLLGVNEKGKYKIIFCSDDKKYGGDGKLAHKTYTAVNEPSHGKQYSLRLTVPKHSTIYLVKIPE